ncbi:MAG: hypothetical protein ACK8QZ_01800, partial [Anaerolineales bacterium]
EQRILAGWQKMEKNLEQAEQVAAQRPTWDMARWKERDYAESARWEAQRKQQAYQHYRRGERADPQPAAQPAGSSESKPWWQRAKEWVQQKIVQPAQQAVPTVMNWVDQHQTEIALGIGIAAGIAAIVLSGGAATPLVAAAWVAGSAAVAGGVAALGTVGLNAYFQRPLTTNLWRNLGYAAGAAAVTATAGFVLQAVAPTVTRAAAQFCLGHVTTCSVAAPVFKGIDYAWTGYDVWQSQRTLNNPRAGTDEKLLAAVNIGLAAWSESLEPDDALAIGLPLDDVVRKELMAKFAEILKREGKDAAFDYLRRVLGEEKAALAVTRMVSHIDDVARLGSQAKDFAKVAHIPGADTLLKKLLSTAAPTVKGAEFELEFAIKHADEIEEMGRVLEVIQGGNKEIDFILKGNVFVNVKNYDWSKYNDFVLKSETEHLVEQAQSFLKYNPNAIKYVFKGSVPDSVRQALEAVGVVVEVIP